MGIGVAALAVGSARSRAGQHHPEYELESHDRRDTADGVARDSTVPARATGTRRCRSDADRTAHRFSRP
ncbi:MULTISPECIES: hypothetical protein [unclassified Micromonospora]|uniref:hypothetical protein n=1 Tax=unclassified Micromonospora TaxID=2617518 RepID=UPI001B397B57|nr:MULTISPECIES: hypothetical protein [unclassified Micromonospora]MBQ1041532.1 hypothetical protein [Micromonospora sp. C72]MBQ1053423.1 hypothetical protein [Micromonospora sp. C32]